MVAILSWATGLIQDPVVKVIFAGGVAVLGWGSYEMRMTRLEMSHAREDLKVHTGGMYERLDPTFKVTSALSAPNPDRPREMILFKYLDGYETLRTEISEIRRDVGDVKIRMNGMDGKLDEVLKAVKGRKP